MNPLEEKLNKLRADFDALNQEFHRTNFTANQDFPKYCDFTSRLKVPHASSNPTIGVVGDIVEVGGKLKICTVASTTSPTWTVVGDQTA